jgi:uncharacterized protein (TIGR00255 family)
MTIRSMTGFGQGSTESPEIRVTVELRGVNNRYTDVRFRVPAELNELESEMRRGILERVKRGRVEVTVGVERQDGTETRQALNRPLLEEVSRAAEDARSELGLEGALDLTGVLSIQGMFRTESVEVAWTEPQKDLLRQALEAGLGAFDTDRRREGEALRVDILSRIDAMLVNAKKAEQRAAEVPEVLRDKLVQRLDKLADVAELDPARVAQEAAYLADRSDVTEESVRLEGHLTQARALLDRPDGEPLGKRLEFLLQEIHRESNTICSKAADLQLTQHALAVKLEVEKAREQVLNLE